MENKKLEGNNAFQENRIDDAIRIYTEALELDPLNAHYRAVIFTNRAAALMKKSDHRSASDDCSRAIELDGSSSKAHMRRGRCRMELQEWEEAAQDFDSVVRLEEGVGNQPGVASTSFAAEAKQLSAQCKARHRKEGKKDHYQILGVARDATDDQIKKAYRKLALLYHPGLYSLCA